MEAAIKTALTDMMGCDYPVIVAPMFLVSNEAMVIAGSNGGAIGAAPSLNWRTSESFAAALEEISAGTDKPYAINLIVNKSNARLEEDLKIVERFKVPMVITSLGNPAEVIRRVHDYGGKVFCDVTTLEYGQKVKDAGADGVIAVSAGAGGHAGHISPLVLIPHLKEKLGIPVIAAGGISTGKQILAAFALGADAVQMGTRFIASDEATVADDYKQAIINCKPEDIIMTSRISGHPAAVIRTPYVDKLGTDLPPFEKFLLKYPATAKYTKMLRHMFGTNILESSATKPSWKTVWSAGQGAGLINDILPTGEILQRLMREYHEAKRTL